VTEPLGVLASGGFPRASVTEDPSYMILEVEPDSPANPRTKAEIARGDRGSIRAALP